MQTDKSGQMGPRSSRDNNGRARDRRGGDRENVNQLPLGSGTQTSNNNNTAPAVPGFGFPFMQNGMPMFSMPGQNGAQPPGAS